MDKTITVDGIEYVEKNDNNIQPAVETDHVIIIAQRGWIFEGHVDRSITDEIVLLNANVVRSWSNGKGIGGLCKKDYKDDYTLDAVGTIRFPKEAIIASIDITSW